MSQLSKIDFHLMGLLFLNGGIIINTPSIDLRLIEPFILPLNVRILREKSVLIVRGLMHAAHLRPLTTRVKVGL